MSDIMADMKSQRKNCERTRRFAGARFGAIRAMVAFSVLALGLFDARAAQLEKPNLKIVTGGTSSQIFFLIPALARQLGYFKDEGLNIEWFDAGSGAKGVQALLAGNADFTVGSYEHAIQLRAKGQPLTSIVVYNESAANVFGVTKERAAKIKDGKLDLKGAQIGVTSPGSSTHMFATLVVRNAGLQDNDVAYIGVGTSAGAVAAFRGGKIDAMSNTDPIINELVGTGDMVIVADGRKLDDSKKYYGGPYVSGCLYTTADFIEKNPQTAQAIVNAIVRVFRWLRTADAEQIMKVLPPDYIGPDRDLYKRSIESNIGSWSKTGLISADAAKTVQLNVARFDPSIGAEKVDLSKTYTNTFVENALKTFP